MKNINWYPGHMKKTRELIQENLKMVDAVVEVIDARIPVSSRNPIIDELVSGKPRIVALNKSDLADGEATDRWVEFFSGNYRAVSINANTGEGVKDLLRTLEKMDMKRNRFMVVGVPNVGKSSLINRLTGRKSAQTGDRPGVTKGKQWLKTANGMQLLDTPGILWPKFEDPKAGLNLAFCGSIKDEILDVPDLALELIKVLQNLYPDMLADRYKLDELFIPDDYNPETGAPLETEQEAALANMEAMAMKRGCIMSGKRIDYERIGKLVLDEFRSAKIGRITLELPND